MNIQAYIESGILEEYVLGQLPPDQRAEVESMAAQHPEIRSEINTIEEALSKYGMSFAKPLPASVKANVLDRISRETPNNNGGQRATSGGSSGIGLWITGLVLLTAGLIWSLFSLNSIKSERDTLKEEMDSNRVTCDSVRNRMNELELQMAVLQDPGLQLVFMLGTEKSKSSQAVVHYNPTKGTSYLRVDSLPKPVSGKQYQLWAIVNGAPVSMGVFDIPTDTLSLIPLPHIAQAQAFAVTLENAGGVPSPTMEEMYVIGNVSG